MKPTEPVVVKHGYLEKKSSTSSSWKRKYFTLSDNHTLLIADSPSVLFALCILLQQEQPSAAFNLTTAVVYSRVEKKGKDKPLLFNIRTSQRDMLLRATTIQEKEEWTSSLKKYSKQGPITLSKQGSFLGKTVDPKQQ